MAGKPATLRIDIIEDSGSARKGLQKTGAEAVSASADFDALGQAMFNALEHGGAQLSDSAEKMEKVGAAAGDTASGLQAIGGALQATGVADFTKQLGIASAVLDGIEGVTRIYTVTTQIAGVAQQFFTTTTVENTAAVEANTVASKAAQLASKAWAAAQWLLNAAMEANPIGLIIIGVLALIAVIVLLWTKSETFRTVVLAIWSAMTGAATAVWDALRAAATAALDFVAAYFGAWLRGVKLIFSAVTTAGAAVFSALRTAATAVLDFVLGYFRLWLRGIQLVYDTVKAAGAAVWLALTTAVRTAIDTAASIVSGLTGKVSAVFDDIRRAASGAFDPIHDAIQGVIDTVQKLIDKIKDIIDWLGKIKIPSALTGLIGKIPGLGRSAAVAGVQYGPAAAGVARSLAVPSGPLGFASLVSGGIVVQVQIGDTPITDMVTTIVRGTQTRLARRITGTAGVLR